MSRTGRMLLAVVVLLALVVGVAMWYGARESHQGAGAAAADFSDPGLIERGRYLAQVGNCMGCHTAPGGAPYSGGRAIPTPYGTFFGPNITPHATTGIGNWTADDFWRALHDGKAPDGTLLYPVFPYPTYTNVSREDADALYAYLKSLPPIDRPNREHEVAFPYNQRWLLSLWRAVHFRPGPLDPVPDQSEQWIRGRYLVEGLAHCAECHTPRTRWGGLDRSKHLQGGIIPGQDWYATPLTGDPVTGLGEWSADDIASLLKSGLSTRSHATGPMAESVYWGYQHLTDGDTEAIAAYLKSLPAADLESRGRQGTQAGASVLELGRQVYEQHCAQCHRADGRGEPGAWPPLAGNPSVVADSPINAVRVVLDGGFAPATTGNPQPHGMPPYRHVLNDAQVAAVVSYIRSAWGNRTGAVSLPEARRIREDSR